MSLDSYELDREQQQVENLKRPLRGIVSSVLPEKELYKVEGFGSGGSPYYAIRHPMLGVNSWIRAVAEPGTSVKVQRQGDIQQQEIWGYISNKVEGVIQQATRDKAVAYRVLQAGENEVMSSGKAGVFWSQYGDLEMQGGTLRHNLMTTEAEIFSAAPSYKKTWWRNTPNTLGHEERTGVVKRPNQKWPYTKNEPVQLSNQEYAIEHSRWLKDSSDQLLTEHQEGHVINESGSTITQGSTNKDLRFLKRIYSSIGGQLNLEIDQELNTLIVNSSAAKETKVNFGAKNDVTWQAKKWTVQMSDSGKLIFTRSLSITSQQVRVNSPLTIFGQSGGNAALLGTTYVTTVLTPMLSTMLAAATTLANSTFIDQPVAIKALAIVMTQALTALQASIPSILSTQVFFSV